MSDRRIEISARAVLDCLTGEVSRPEFLDIVGHYPIEFLQKHLAGGGGLSCVRLEKAVDDDDLLVLDLSDADAATAEFSARPPAE